MLKRLFCWIARLWRNLLKWMGLPMARVEIPSPPPTFDGKFDELFNGWAARVLLAPDVVETFHRRLVDYVRSADPRFLVRMVAGTTRGEDIRTRSGALMRATDNSPAWQIHWDLFTGNVDATRDMAAYIESLPCHMFNIGADALDGVSSAVWHIAHIFDVKNGDTDFMSWDRAELTWRMVRNIHPCNYFYVPVANWQKYGGDKTVLPTSIMKFAERYSGIWAEFESLAQAETVNRNDKAAEYRYFYPLRTGSAEIDPSRSQPQRPPVTARNGMGCSCRVSYPFTRLCFKADAIEPLGWDDAFCVITRDDGIFRFTKREFYEVFPRVPLTKSYREARIYHFPKVLERAWPFRITSCSRA